MSRRQRALARAAALAAFCFLCASGTAAGEPAVGGAAPAFSLSGSDGRTYTLESVLAEHAGLVLAWFPKAFTPG